MKIIYTGGQLYWAGIDNNENYQGPEEILGFAAPPATYPVGKAIRKALEIKMIQFCCDGIADSFIRQVLMDFHFQDNFCLLSQKPVMLCSS